MIWNGIVRDVRVEGWTKGQRCVGYMVPARPLADREVSLAWLAIAGCVEQDALQSRLV